MAPIHSALQGGVCQQHPAAGLPDLWIVPYCFWFHTPRL